MTPMFADSLIGTISAYPNCYDRSHQRFLHCTCCQDLLGYSADIKQHLLYLFSLPKDLLITKVHSEILRAQSPCPPTRPFRIPPSRGPKICVHTYRNLVGLRPATLSRMETTAAVHQSSTLTPLPRRRFAPTTFSKKQQFVEQFLRKANLCTSAFQSTRQLYEAYCSHHGFEAKPNHLGSYPPIPTHLKDTLCSWSAFARWFNMLNKPGEVRSI